MFQLCSCNTDNIIYCSQGKCIHLLLHTFHICMVLVDPQARKSSLCLASLLHHHHLLAVCSRTQVDRLPKFLQMENVTKHTIADMHVLCVTKYLIWWCRRKSFNIQFLRLLVENHVMKLVEWIDVFIFTNATHKELLH